MKKIVLIIPLLIFVGFFLTKVDYKNILRPSTAYAVGDLTVNWGVPSGQPIFTISNMKPGDIETHTVTVINNATILRPVGVRGLLTNETGGFSQTLSIVISHGGTDIYGGTSSTGPKTLAQFFVDSMSQDGISLTNLNPGQSTGYVFTVTFLSTSGNEFQNKQTTFDIQIGISLPIPTQCLGMKFSHIIYGTQGNDTIQGTSGNDLIFGLEGNDVIHGNSGDDCIVVGNGNNTVFSGSGDDVIIAGNGKNILFGESGNDVLIGGTNLGTVVDGGSGKNSCKAATETHCQIHL